ncbi:MAG: hypothetical protein KDD44_09890, partial [Bdellovibrionales bacterium]|nr:hypothetical protein [Bdellovibrionales bacterium]
MISRTTTAAAALTAMLTTSACSIDRGLPLASERGTSDRTAASLFEKLDQSTFLASGSIIVSRALPKRGEQVAVAPQDPEQVAIRRAPVVGYIPPTL